MHLPEDRVVIRLRRTAQQTQAATNGPDTEAFSMPVLRMIRHRRKSIRVPRPVHASRELELPLAANL